MFLLLIVCVLVSNADAYGMGLAGLKQQISETRAQVATLEAQLGQTQHELNEAKRKREEDVDEGVRVLGEAGVAFIPDPNLGVSDRAGKAREAFRAVVKGKEDAEARVNGFVAKQKKYDRLLSEIITSEGGEVKSESEEDSLESDVSEKNPLGTTRRIHAIGDRDKQQRKKIDELSSQVTKATEALRTSVDVADGDDLGVLVGVATAQIVTLKAQATRLETEKKAAEESASQLEAGKKAAEARAAQLESEKARLEDSRRQAMKTMKEKLGKEPKSLSEGTEALVAKVSEAEAEAKKAQDEAEARATEAEERATKAETERTSLLEQSQAQYNTLLEQKTQLEQRLKEADEQKTQLEQELEAAQQGCCCVIM